MEKTTPIGEQSIERAERAESSRPTVAMSDRKAASAPGPATIGRTAAILGIAMALVLGVSAGFLFAHLHHNADAVVATVNGMPITKQEFLHRLEVANGTAVLNEMVSEEMLLQFAHKMGVVPSDSEVETKYAESSKQPDFQKNLAASHQTPEDIKHNLRVQLARTAIIGKDITVTDADIQNFYKTNIDRHNPQARYYQPEMVQIAAIITDKEEDAKQALHALASGLPFTEAVKRYSKDSSKSNGGILPAMRHGQIDAQKFPGLEPKLFAMKVGQQLDMEKVAGAWWIIRCVGKAAEQTVPFEKVKAECRTGAMLAKGLPANGQKMETEYQTFRKAADVKTLWPQYKDSLLQK